MIKIARYSPPNSNSKSKVENKELAIIVKRGACMGKEQDERVDGSWN